jgi:5S rRNA maturation endonuclease (ribonuclease M5)
MNKLEQLDRTLKKLGQEKCPIIVEGKRDVKALSQFGITSRHLCGTLQSLVEATKSKKVIILTDYDRRGEILGKQLGELFKNEGIHADLEYRKQIKRLANINEIEDIASEYRRMKENSKGETNGKDLH